METSNLQCFIVFDQIPPREEGAEPIIYWHTSTHEMEHNSLINQAGLFITFLNWTQKFSPDFPCDYISTSKHEISLLKLYGTIWMGVSVYSRSSDDRFILHSILRYCRIMFSHFFVALPELDDPLIDPSNSDNFNNVNFDINVDIEEVKKVLKYAFPYIVESIDWTRLDYSYEFNSIQQSRVSHYEELKDECKKFIQNNQDIVDGIAILHKREVIYSSYNTYVTRAITFAMRKRFKLIYLPDLVQNPMKLSWLIGLYIDRNGLNSIFLHPIYFDNKVHFIIAFKLGIYKIFLTIPDGLEIDEQFLICIPRKMSKVVAVVKNIKILKVLYPPKINEISFAISQNEPLKQKMSFNGNLISTFSKIKIDSDFIKGHELAVTYDKSPKIGYPDKENYFVFCDSQIGENAIETLSLFQTPSSIKQISPLLKMKDKILSSTNNYYNTQKNDGEAKQCSIQ